MTSEVWLGQKTSGADSMNCSKNFDELQSMSLPCVILLRTVMVTNPYLISQIQFSVQKYNLNIWKYFITEQ